jgi:hypothetical protein
MRRRCRRGTLPYCGPCCWLDSRLPPPPPPPPLPKPPGRPSCDAPPYCACRRTEYIHGAVLQAEPLQLVRAKLDTQGEHLAGLGGRQAPLSCDPHIRDVRGLFQGEQ